MNFAFAVDSSVLVAILKNEPEAAAFEAALFNELRVIGRPTVMETRIWCLRNLNRSGAPWLEVFLESAATHFADFDAAIEALAVDAYARFGKGRHPAQLNYGDCMAYAVARQHDVPLLFKGADFAQTDVKVHPNSVVII